jgi:hypothetical protein
MTSLLRIAALALLLAGCTTARESFAGRDAGVVWTAMVAAARTPDYQSGPPQRRWTVRENNVWLDEPQRRIEIHRALARTVHRSGGEPRHERRTWRLRVTLEEAEGGPTAVFLSRDPAIAAHVWEEAVRYFDDVWELLGGRPAAAPAEPEGAFDDVVDSLGADGG